MNMFAPTAEPEHAGHAAAPAEPEEVLKRINITFYANGFIPDVQ